MAEKFDDVIREYIDFVNEQVGVYMDAMAGFENIKLLVERQVHRVLRPTSKKTGENGRPIIVWSSYEDPSEPDIIHNRIVRASDYIAANEPGGLNEQRHAHSIIVFLVAYWEHSIRPRLARAKGVKKNAIVSNVMGDLTILRNAILHSKAIISPKEFKRLRALSEMFRSGGEVIIGYDNMHKIFYMIKQDLARLLYEWLGIKDAPVDPSQLRDIAIQKTRRQTK